MKDAITITVTGNKKAVSRAELMLKPVLKVLAKDTEVEIKTKVVPKLEVDRENAFSIL